MNLKLSRLVANCRLKRLKHGYRVHDADLMKHSVDSLGNFGVNIVEFGNFIHFFKIRYMLGNIRVVLTSISMVDSSIA